MSSTKSEGSTASWTGPDEVKRSQLWQHEGSYQDLMRRGGQIANQYWQSTFDPTFATTATDLKATRLEEVELAERFEVESAISRSNSAVPPPSRDLVRDIRVSERWVGRVLEVSDDVISAQLAPLGSSEPVVIGDIGFDQIDEADQQLVRPGATFYLTIGYVPLTATTQYTAQFVKFSRVGRWQQSEISEIEARGREMFESIEIDDSE
jgi:hypothetical protein